jgi:hypothetical protein
MIALLTPCAVLANRTGALSLFRAVRRTGVDRMPYRLFLLVMLASLAACVSPEELRRRDEAVCAGYGFQPGTNDFAACLQRESLARRFALSQQYQGWGPGWGPPWGGPSTGWW